MIKLEHTDVYGWEAAIRGMRNPMNSWAKSDTEYCDRGGVFRVPKIGKNDLDLMKRLAKGGSVHAKYRRMINVTVDITCHHTWWAEFDTYKVATVRNSCSKMHKIHVAPFTLDNFSHEGCDEIPLVLTHLERTVAILEKLRRKFNDTQEKKYWRAIIELLPMGYNLKATVQLNYEVLVGMYRDRKNHKLVEWHDFCRWIESLPYSELITGATEGDGEARK